MWWRFRERRGPKAHPGAKRLLETTSVDPWLYVEADDQMGSPELVRAFFEEWYQHSTRRKPGVSDLEPVKTVDHTKLRAAGEFAGRKIFYEATFGV